MVQLQNPETGTIGWVDTSSSIVRATYEKDYQNFVANFKSYCTHSGTDYLDLRVDRSYTKQLLEFLKEDNLKRYLYIFVLLISIFSFAQNEVKISADTNQVFIGDIINLNILVNSSEQILWPDIEEVISPMEIQNLSSIDSSFVNSQYIQSKPICTTI